MGKIKEKNKKWEDNIGFPIAACHISSKAQFCFLATQ
jgi:hypothetical protein